MFVDKRDMSTEDLQKRTTVNIQEKANLIWAIADNFRSYLNHFSENVVDIIEKFDFDKEITKLDHNGILYNVIQEFCSKKAYMGADEISAVDMGYIFEELVRKFSESYDEQAGAHFKDTEGLSRCVLAVCSSSNS